MKNKKVIAIILAVMMLSSMLMGALTVMAATPYATVHPEITGDGLGIKEKIEVTQQGAANPNVTYTLTLGSVMKVYEADGKTYGDVAKVTGASEVKDKVLGTVTFNAGEVIGLGNKTTPYTVPDDVVTAINALGFERPGIYYWEINKTVNNSDFPNNQKSSVSANGTALVIRVDDNNGVLSAPVVSINVLDNDKKPTGNKDALYEDAFVRAPGSLTIKNEVTGNQGSKDQYFKYEIEITGMTEYAGQKITPIGDNSVTGVTTPKYGEDFLKGFSNLQDVTIDADGKATITLWLKDQEEIEIPNIPQVKDVQYKITEYKYDGYDITTTHTDPDDSDATKTGTTDNIGPEKLNPDGSRVVFKNDKATTIPTGIVTAVAPAAAVIAIGGIGTGIVFVGKRRRDEELEEED